MLVNKRLGLYGLLALCCFIAGFILTPIVNPYLDGTSEIHAASACKRYSDFATQAGRGYGTDSNEQKLLFAQAYLDSMLANKYSIYLRYGDFRTAFRTLDDFIYQGDAEAEKIWLGSHTFIESECRKWGYTK